MNALKLLALLLASLLPGLASAAADMYLHIESGKGESAIVHCVDGACATGPLAAGAWTVTVCTAEGKTIRTDLRLEYAIVSPRDSTSGMASGKRQHGDITIRKDIGRSAAANTIIVEEAGTELAIGTTAAAVEAAQAKITKSRSNIQNN
jgi:hypothetical protein